PTSLVVPPASLLLSPGLQARTVHRSVPLFCPCAPAAPRASVAPSRHGFILSRPRRSERDPVAASASSLCPAITRTRQSRSLLPQLPMLTLTPCHSRRSPLLCPSLTNGACVLASMSRPPFHILMLARGQRMRRLYMPRIGHAPAPDGPARLLLAHPVSSPLPTPGPTESAMRPNRSLLSQCRCAKPRLPTQACWPPTAPPLPFAVHERFLRPLAALRYSRVCYLGAYVRPRSKRDMRRTCPCTVSSARVGVAVLEE
ncbi:hypothetical protein EVG20_g802, partial [Dentipellis fragilis]